MKLLIAVDMEGISGVVHWDHVTPGQNDYPRFCRLMTGDVNAAIEGAAKAGVSEFIVADGHHYARNILIENLDHRARLNTGAPSPFSMVQGVDQDVQAAIFVGYHARIGTQNGILNHTWSPTKVANVWLNGRLVGEFGLNAGMCGYFNVPVLMVTGDAAVCTEAAEWVPGIVKTEVKKGSGSFSAECLPVEASQALIRQNTEKAVLQYLRGNNPQPLKIGVPVSLGIEFFQADMADGAAMLPTVKRLDARKIEITAQDMPSAYQLFRAAVRMS